MGGVVIATVAAVRNTARRYNARWWDASDTYYQSGLYALEDLI